MDAGWTLTSVQRGTSKGSFGADVDPRAGNLATPMLKASAYIRDELLDAAFDASVSGLEWWNGVAKPSATAVLPLAVALTPPTTAAAKVLAGVLPGSITWAARPRFHGTRT